MSRPYGSYSLGPDDARLSVKTGRSGTAAKAGHELTFTVLSWSAELRLSENPATTALTVTADARSLRVIAASGGAMNLGDSDRAKIEKSIDDDVLKGMRISFRSTQVRAVDHNDHELSVRGTLELLGRSGPVDISLAIAEDGRFAGTATVIQTEFGIKPFSTLFGALKVADAVEVTVDGTLPVS